MQYQQQIIHQKTQQVTKGDWIDFDIYLFINTKSGGQTGMRFMALQMETARFSMHGLRIDTSFYNLNDSTSKKKGLQKLKKAQSMGHHCRAIVCGGDGTVLWVVKQIVQYGIPIHNVPIGVIPIGTGNDFSRQMGWGGKQQTMIGEKFEKLKELVFEWIDSEVVNFDVWEMTMNLYENGVFTKVNGERKDEVMDHGVKTFRKAFTNYCSVGLDGRIGYSFDKHRSASRGMNLCIYGCIGCGKACRNPKMDQMIHSMIAQPNPHHQQHTMQQQVIQSPMMQIYNGDSRRRIVTQQMLTQPTTSGHAVFSNQPGSPLTLNKGYENIVALNINSFMGGCKDMWYTKKLAVTNTNEQMYGPTSYNDGVLEFVAWKSGFGLGYQRCFKTGAKVAQGGGPFVYHFNQSQEPEFHTYLQVDGEFYKAFHPKDMTYKRSDKVPGGYIRVLKYRGRKRKDFIKPQ